MRRDTLGTACGALGACTLVVFLVAPANAQTLDAAAARAQLEQGYELKKAGRCADAIPHLLESHRLDDQQAKTLLNLADCEEHAGKFVDAQKHWVAARDLARKGADRDIAEEASVRLSALERRMPRITIRLSASAAEGSEVLRDGVALGAVSLGVPLPTDPGKHLVLVRARGRSDRATEVSLSEGETRVVEVEAGSPEPDGARASVAPESHAAPSSRGDGRAEEPARASGGSRTPAIVVAGAGGVGLVAGAVFGLVAMGQKSKSGCNADSTPALCPTSADRDIWNGARNWATASTIAFAAGGLLTAGGGVLWLLTGNASSASAPRVGVGPIASPAGYGAEVRGTW